MERLRWILILVLALILVAGCEGCTINNNSQATASGGGARATSNTGLSCVESPDGTSLTCTPVNSTEVATQGGGATVKADSSTGVLR